MTVTLTVVFLASGGFAVSNLNAGCRTLDRRDNLAQRRLDTVSKAREAKCKKRGERCRALEVEERNAIAASAPRRRASVLRQSRKQQHLAFRPSAFT
jgi:hypothetical protein